MNLPAEEKTEQATAKRRKDEREKGNVFMSREILLVAGLLAVFYTLQILGSLILQTLVGGIEKFWNMAATVQSLTIVDMPQIYIQSLLMYAIPALPPLLVAGFVAIVLTMFQTRGLVAPKAFTPKFSRLNPAQGIKKVFSARGIVELMKALLKIVVLAYVSYNTYLEHFPEFPRLMEVEFASVIGYTGAFIMDIVTSVSVIFVFLAAADYLFQRWQFEKDLRMTKQEIKEEYKQTEGDPQIKAKIRDKQRQMSQARMMQNVPTADVVVRNPTHYAVAIQYDAEKNRAPVVVAKGADLVALRIIKVAQENKVMTVENRPLARSLYDNVPLDREVPEEFYQTVAEVLAYVYSTEKRATPKAHGSSKEDRPN